MNPSPTDIRRLRTTRGLTQQQLATLLGLSARQRITEYESGKRRMSPQLYRLMRLVLDPFFNRDTKGE